MDRRDDYPLPAAWRGVASPGYLRLARWLSLAEDLHGVRGLALQGPGAAEGALIGQRCQTGYTDMTLTVPTQQTAHAEALRRFMTAELTRHERLVVMLFYADELEVDEIAQVLDLPVATVAEVFERTVDRIAKHFA